MAFFEKMSETIASKSKDVAKKAKEMAEVSGLNAQIGTQKDIINKIYKEVGEMVCENREGWSELNLEEQFARLDAAKAEIERLQGEIYRAKDVKLCANCGAEIERDAAFCPKCGTQAPVLETEEIGAEIVDGEVTAETTVCPNCGREMETGTVFCPACGTKISES